MPLITKKLHAASKKINHSNLYFIQKLTATITVDEALTMHPHRPNSTRGNSLYFPPLLSSYVQTPRHYQYPQSPQSFTPTPTNAWQHDVIKQWPWDILSTSSV
jgi:hypothetical protein